MAVISTFQPYMNVESNRSYVDCLFSPDQNECLEAVTQLKNAVIGSNHQKETIIEMGIVPRLFQILNDDMLPISLKIETAVTIGSLAKGTDENVQSLLDAGVINVMLRGLLSSDQKYVEACLRVLRTVFLCPLAPLEVLYSDPAIIPHLITMSTLPLLSYQECVMSILTSTCKTPEHQILLSNNGAIQAIAVLLTSPAPRVQLPTLRCLAQLCYQNEKVSNAVTTTSFGGKTVPDILVSLMARDKKVEMQLAAAKCLTLISRAGAVEAEDPRILYKTLPTLVRLCKKDQLPENRAESAETLAYLTEVDTELQRIASISDHLISVLAELLKYQPPSAGLHSAGPISTLALRKLEHEMKTAQEMKQAAFKAFASLGANDEEIRKKVIETESLMEHIVMGLSDSNLRVRLAAIRCLHSLSRSVHQLRTTFQDHAVWRPLMKLLHNSPDDMTVLASSTLCNLLLEFSPSKEVRRNPILESGAIELLCNLTLKDDPALRLNGVWALMNMAFQADQKVKSRILESLGTDQVFRLLSDPDVNVLMKTLGLLRNLLSTKPHIDHIMELHGKQIMQAVILILEGDHSAEVKEQALCILANIADGNSAKDYIMTNEDVLKKLTSYMMHSNVKLQIAATFCISTLSWTDEEGYLERQSKLREMGIEKLLQQLLTTTDKTLFERVKIALSQFTS